MRYVKRVSTIIDRINQLIGGWYDTRANKNTVKHGTFAGKYCYTYQYKKAWLLSDTDKGQPETGSALYFTDRYINRIEKYYNKALIARLDILYTDKNRYGIWCGGYDITSISAEYVSRFYATDTEIYVIPGDREFRHLVLFMQENLIYAFFTGD